MWCNGSTNVFGAFSFGSSPDITTNIKEMKNKNKDIDPIYTLIVAYMTTIGLLLWWSINVSV